MSDVDKLLGSLSSAARREPGPQIDVRARVVDTLSIRPLPAKLDIVPVAFAGVALVLAVAALLLALPLWQTLTDPWVAYMP